MHLIALIEDSPTEAELIQEYCKRFSAENSVNIDVKWFPKGETFLRDYQPIYDLVLMDIQMPVMNGYEAAQAIRALHRPDTDALPIVALTANAFDEDVLRSRKAGMNAHLSKPLDIRKLVETLQGLM